MMDVLNHFKHGLEKYRQGNWERAISAFQDALQGNPTDKLSQLYIERCEHLRANPPEGEWNGVWVLKSK